LISVNNKSGKKRRVSVYLSLSVSGEPNLRDARKSQFDARGFS
jgi:hypothetical protein